MKAKFPADMKVVCSYCGRHLRGDKNAPRVSHGACLKCYKAQMKKLDELGYPPLKNPRFERYRLTIDGVTFMVLAESKRGVDTGPLATEDWKRRGLAGMLVVRRPKGNREQLAYRWDSGRVTLGDKMPAANPGPNETVADTINGAIRAGIPVFLTTYAKRIRVAEVKHTANGFKFKTPRGTWYWLTIPQVDQLYNQVIRRARPAINPRGAGGRPRNAPGPRAVNYRIFAGTGRPVRVATKVIFPDGREIKFLERLSRAEAVRQAAALYTRGDAFSNPANDKRQFMAAVATDPFYKTLLIKGAQRLIAALKQGKFDRREWLRTIEAIVERIARENKISLTRMEKLKLALTLARQLWDTYVHGKRVN